jgi:DNA polymerase gamma 1
MQSGWTRYNADGSFEPVDHPAEEALTFDVETMYRDNPYPVLATAASAKYWYCWVSPWLLGESEDKEHLIPLPGNKPRVIVGHNVGYDRARISGEYNLERTQNRFLDTMSLHNATSGLSSPQRIAWMQYRKSKRLRDAEDAKEEDLDDEKSKPKPKKKRASSSSSSALSVAEDDEEGTPWQDVSSLSSLVEVAKLHCDIDLSKTMRDAFETVDRAEILDAFDDVVSYCAHDVWVTHQVFKRVFPAFLRICPSPVSFAGMLTMGNPFLPIDQSWTGFINEAEGVFQRLLKEVERSLHQLAEDAMALHHVKDDERGGFVWEHDPWLKQLDWTDKRPRGGVNKHRASSKKKKPATEDLSPSPSTAAPELVPVWYANLLDVFGKLDIKPRDSVTPLLFRMAWQGHPVSYSKEHGWVYLTEPSAKNPNKDSAVAILHGKTASPIPPSKRGAVRTLVSTSFKKAYTQGLLETPYPEAGQALQLAKGALEGEQGDVIRRKLVELAEEAKNMGEAGRQDPWLGQLDWSPTPLPEPVEIEEVADDEPPAKEEEGAGEEVGVVNPADVSWPKWYWELHAPGGRQGADRYKMQLTTRSRVAPLLFKLSWDGHPLYRSRQHGWIYRVTDSDIENAQAQSTLASQRPLEFDHSDDTELWEDSRGEGRFFKLPHKDGESANVGRPLSKSFVSAFEDGRLGSEYAVAKAALQMNAQCSYWISARSRIVNQLVVWGKEGQELGFPRAKDGSFIPYGMILPQVVPMGTVTRRAVENTWLAASNAKKNRVGSELKAMVRAPAGYAIVGADVDSEELWISSVMGDAQFGAHGATAIGWMTLQGTKSAGTDLHSKTASILGISRDEAKVFNYSRIYGAGVRHAVQLLTKSGASTLSDAHAKKLAKDLYASTKGINTYRKDYWGRRFWYGGSESYLFNKLEAIATSEEPRTPALGCGVTQALVAKHLPNDRDSGTGRYEVSSRTSMASDYMPSRVNWVVQSSGVDYLHLLIVAMEYLIQRFDISARYMISVHDEIRYLVKEEDKYRAGLALQIANIWTRSLFAFKLEMNDLPQVRPSPRFFLSD